MWCSSLDDLFRKADAEYEQRRDSDAGGRVLRGLRFARNAGVHLLLAVHEWTKGCGSIQALSADMPQKARWKRRDELEHAPRKNCGNEVAYDDYVAGKSVLETLTAAQGFLWMRAMTQPAGTQSLPWTPQPEC